ncbi:MAG: hypothetical protein R3C49_17030 [Planctomycetaceae bacterium]
MKRSTFLKRLGSSLLAFALPAVCSAESVSTNTTSFRIPFAVEAGDSTDPRASAILFVSKNHGPMEQADRVSLKDGGFEFSAPTDGFYGFAVRIADADGRIADDPGQMSPELEVEVDTTAPSVQLQLAEIGPGEVSVTWVCSEASIAPNSLILEYAEGSDGRWLPINVTPSASGHAVVKSQPGNAVSVRSFVSDLAGNQGIGSGQIVLTSEQNAPTRDPRGIQATTQTTTRPQQTVRSAGQPLLGASPFGQHSTPQSSPAVAQPTHSQMPLQGYPTYPTQPAYGMNPPAASNPYRSAASTVIQPSLTTNGGGYSQMSGMNPTAGQVLNTREFDIAYEVQDVGPSGVSGVQLYVTENNGQEWFTYGDDPDLRSPFQVDSRGEGTFGFAVRVRNGLGFSDPPPQPGELPSVVVTVDQTPPVTSMAPPQIIATGTGSIRLNWQVSEAHPSTAPVRLEYSMSSSGPWTPVFDWQADTRGYELPMQPGMPGSLYFRLLARDAAGNISTAQTAQPLLIDQHRPSARVLSVQPVSSSRQF